MSLSLFAAVTRAPRWRWWRLGLRLVGWGVLAAWSLALLVWLTFHWGILPRLDEWRPRIEAYASHALGLPVQIGRIQARSSGWIPAMELDDVVLRDARGREALRLPKVSAALSVSSLLSMQLRFEQLLIDGPRLEVRRDAQGRLRVAGLDVEGDAVGEGGALADRFFEQHEFVIRGGVLRWVDELRAAPPLELSQVQLVVRNRLNRHDLRLDATPPPAWGQRFTLVARARQPLLARAGDWQRWRGTVHANLPQVLVQELRRHVDLPFQLTRGEGALRAWVDFESGLPKGGTADVALRDVSVRLAGDVQPLELAQVNGRVTVDRGPEGVRITADGLGFETAEGRRWPTGRLSLSWRQHQVLSVADLAKSPGPQAVTGGEFSAEQLDLALMAELAERLPIGAGVRRLLDELDPKGGVHDLSAKWQGPLDAPTHYQVKAEIKGMAMAPSVSPEPGGIGRPGWRGADLAIQATEAGGQAQLSLRDGGLELPGVFEKPLVSLRRFAGVLTWRIEPVAGAAPRVELKVNSARFENEDAQGELEATWHAGPGSGFGKGRRLPGVLELSGRLTNGKATQVVRYLPLGIPTQARDYVRHAVLGGKVNTASFKVKGDLWEFPFVQRSEGEFRIAGQVQDVQLAYVPSVPAAPGTPAWASPWPAFSSISGELVFDRTSMQIQQAKARLWGLEIFEVKGGIRNLAEHPTLEIDGRARGPAADFIRYVNVTPVGEWIGRGLAQSSAEGTAELKLALSLPLEKLEQSKVNGTVLLQGGDVRIRPDTPLLGAARGRVEFTQQGVHVNAQVRSLGGEAQVEGGSQPDGSLRFTASGTASAEGLRRAGELGMVSRWAARASGQAPYRVVLTLPRGYPEVLVTSPLTGMALDLPAPLGKPAEPALPLRVQISLAPESRAAGAPLHDQLRVDLGNLLAAQYLRDVSGPEPRVLRGAVAMGTGLPELAPGVRGVADLGAVSADAWLALLPEGGVPGASGDANSPAAPGSTGTSAAAPAGSAAWGGYLPQTLELRAQALTLASRRLTRLTLGLARMAPPAAGWRARVDAEQLRGEVSYFEPRSGTDAGRVQARLARLSLGTSDAESVEGLLEQAPRSVPAVDLQADDFELRGRHLGKLTIDAVNRSRSGVASAREWQLHRLAIESPDAELEATGQWGQAVGGDGRRRMGLDFRLNIRDAGALLQRLGFGEVIRGGKGRLEGGVSWAGSPLGLDLPSLDGRMNLGLESGQFLKAEPGAGRLLSVLSLQSLPRRLILDFRDVFQEGFAFDSLTGDMTLAHGLARTNNLRMRGVQAVVLMEGQADLLRESQNLRVVVVPEINAGTASLAYAVINPAVGLGTFFGQLLLRGPLAAAGTREFHIDGSWSDPQIRAVERSAERPAAAASAAPPSPSAAAAASQPSR